METKVGARLRSAVCETEVIVIRAPGGDIDVRCGGRPMLPADGASVANGGPQVGFADGTTLGKRYADDDLGLEVLVTKAGAGSLAVGVTALPVKDPKRLPSSD